jgi:hypothetical protein
MRRVGSAALAAAAFTLGFATPASALTKHSEESAPIGGGLHTAVATCSSDERAISGGYAIDPGPSFARVSESHKQGGRSWVVTANQELVAWAYCSKRLEVSTATKTVETTGNRSGTVAKARCGRGSDPVSGGWRLVGPDSDIPVFDSRPKGRRWRIRAYDNEGTDLTAFAYCLKNGPDLVRRDGSREIDGAGEAVTARARCKRGQEFLGGGWATTPRPDYFNTDGPDTFFIDVVREGARAWSAGATNFGLLGRIQAIAVCAK